MDEFEVRVLRVLAKAEEPVFAKDIYEPAGLRTSMDAARCLGAMSEDGLVKPVGEDPHKAICPGYLITEKGLGCLK